ncbi:MAG: hypothetical protein ACKV2V_17355, partial [Blastocatellia bacterium]
MQEMSDTITLSRELWDQMMNEIREGRAETRQAIAELRQEITEMRADIRKLTYRVDDLVISHS